MSFARSGKFGISAETYGNAFIAVYSSACQSLIGEGEKSRRIGSADFFFRAIVDCLHPGKRKRLAKTQPGQSIFLQFHPYSLRAVILGPLNHPRGDGVSLRQPGNQIAAIMNTRPDA